MIYNYLSQIMKCSADASTRLVIVCACVTVNQMKRRESVMKNLIFLMDPDLVTTFNYYRFLNVGTVIIMIFDGAKKMTCR